LQFGVEPFNITSYAYEGGEMFIGVFPRSEKARTSYPPVDQGETIPTAWLASKRIKFNDKVVRLDDSDVVKIIQDLKSQIYIEFRAALVKQVIDFMKSVLEVKGILRSGFLSKK
jgi:hypothetical protein